MNTAQTDKRKHSIAPWFIAEQSIGRYEVYSRGTDGSYSVATCVKLTDARLIASAPDLLAALKETREELRSLMVRAERRSLADWARTLLSERMHKIDAAMAMAEGVA